MDGQWCIHRGEIVNLLTLLQIIAASNTVWISQIQKSWVYKKQNWTISCQRSVVFQEEIPMWAVFAKSFSPKRMWWNSIFWIFIYHFKIECFFKSQFQKIQMSLQISKFWKYKCLVKSQISEDKNTNSKSFSPHFAKVFLPKVCDLCSAIFVIMQILLHCAL